MAAAATQNGNMAICISLTSWPDLWYQMALVDTTVEQSLVSFGEGTRGRECVRGEDGSPRGARVEGWVKGDREWGGGY